MKSDHYVTHSVAIAVTRKGWVMVAGAETCERVGNRFFSVESGEEFKLVKIKGKPYFIKGDWK